MTLICVHLGSACVPRAGERVLAIATFLGASARANRESFTPLAL